jgi:transcriptional regulator with GAF, ATPase, and Fis domain
MKSVIPSNSLREQVEKFEAEIIKKVLVECGWNQSKAARKLQTSESNIRYKMKQLNIRKEE